MVGAVALSAGMALTAGMARAGALEEVVATPTYDPVPERSARTGLSLPVGRCVNLGNTLEAPNEGDWGKRIDDRDFDRIRRGGFATVRLPVRFSGHAGKEAPYRIDPAFLGRVRHLVDRATATGLNVIVDLHHDDEVMTDPVGQRDRFVAMWRQIGTAFASAPPSVWFELLNEPRERLTNATLPDLWKPALAAVREENPERPVILGGGETSSLPSLVDLELPDDPFVVPTFHYYDPMTFTHQGATFIHPTPKMGAHWNGAADYRRLADDLVAVQAYVTRTGRVPFVGEFGAMETVPEDERAHYYATVSRAFASIGIASCAWAYRNTFPIVDGKGRWLPGFPDALARPLDRQEHDARSPG